VPATISNAPIEFGVVVSDRDRSVAFYGDVLGLPYLGEIVFPLGRLWRFAIGSAVVKLIGYNDPIEALSPPGHLRAVGYRYLTVQVANIDELVAECARAGCPVPMPVTEAAPGVTFAFVEDPDGNRVELVQVEGTLT
jgi:catechol 2,3-dioxygenase-like lactoylglutathione lyase family enzyme